MIFNVFLVKNFFNEGFCGFFFCILCSVLISSCFFFCLLFLRKVLSFVLDISCKLWYLKKFFSFVNFLWIVCFLIYSFFESFLRLNLFFVISRWKINNWWSWFLFIFVCVFLLSVCFNCFFLWGRLFNKIFVFFFFLIIKGSCLFLN